MTADPSLPPIVRECIALRELADAAEIMLRDAGRPDYSSQLEWDADVARWRDQKQALRPKTTEEILAEDNEPNYDVPKPLSPLENSQRNDEHSASL